MKLTDKEYWDSTREDFVPFSVESTEFSGVLSRYLPRDAGKSCIEIGAYPGRYLCDIAKRFGYKVTALEYSDRAADIRTQFEFNAIESFEIENTDFFDYAPEEKFDVVTSFGFVEHFSDPSWIIKRHIELLAASGFLVIAVPYLGGLQGLLRRLCYTDKQLALIWSSHNTDIMSRKALVTEVEKFGARVVFANYVMSTNIWLDWRSSGMRPGWRRLVWLAKGFDKSLGRFLPSSSIYSPMVLLIAQKR